MKMTYKNLYIGLLAMFAIVCTGCEYDNFDTPDALLSGKVVYEDQPVGIRTNGAKFELWQDGYALRKSIEVYIAQDGTYSASLFSGTYKMVRIAGAPWEAQLNDTIVIDVNGGTEFNVPVTPYFVIRDESFTTQGNVLNTNFRVNQVVASSNISEVNVYLSTSVLTDSNYNDYVEHIDVSGLTLGELTNMNITIPDNLLTNDYLFVRIGVKSSSSNELYYTQVQKITL